MTPARPPAASRANASALPPGPPSHPFVQVARWIRTPMEFQDECAARYGDVFTIRIPGWTSLVVMSNPDAVKELFARGASDVHAGEANKVLKPFLGEHSLLLLDGAEHMRQRKMMMPAFHGERMQAYGQAMLDLTDASMDAWPTGETFPLHSRMQAITLEVILRTVFGIAEGARFRELAMLLTKSLDIVAWPPMLFPPMQRDLGPLSPWGRFRRLTDRATAILLEEIHAARRHGESGSHEPRKDVLAMMCAARDENGDALTDEEIRDELVTLLVAGHETTATALAWAFSHILRDEGLVQRMVREIDAARGANGALVPDAVARIELLDHVAREALRLRPVIPMVGRVLLKPMRVLGYDLPARTVLAASIYLVHRRPSLYPNPAKFDPDRFRTFKPSPSEWLPFGGGIRKCIGAAFALHEMKMVLAAVLSRASLSLATTDVRVVRRAITLTPSDGLLVVAKSISRRAREAAE